MIGDAATDGPGWTLRLARPDDAAALGELHVAAWRETYPGLLPDEMLAGLSVEARTATWARMLALRDASSTVVRLAEVQGRPVGFAATSPQRDPMLGARGYDGEIAAIYLLRAGQRRGIGAALMRAAAADLLERGRKGASLWVLRENATARRFYERHGGSLIGEKSEAHGRAGLVEVAYGWPDLTALARGTV